MTQHLCDSEFPWCPTDARAGDFYKLRVKDLSPTQFAVGKAEVAVRTGRMRKKFTKDPGLLHDYLRVRPVPVVVRGWLLCKLHGGARTRGRSCTFGCC